jgi:hypothetical protein
MTAMAWYYDQKENFFQGRVNFNENQKLHSVIVTFSKPCPFEKLLPDYLQVYQYSPFDQSHDGPLQTQWIDPLKKQLWILSADQRFITHFYIRTMTYDFEQKLQTGLLFEKRNWKEWVKEMDRPKEKGISVVVEEESSSEIVH